MTNSDDFFTGAGGGDRNSASFAFDKDGATVAGPIVEIGDPVQQTEYKTGVPKVDKNGNPQMMLPITLQTDLRNWEGATKPPNDEDGKPKPPSEDSGLRTVWAKFKMRDAIATALRSSGSKLEVGGHLAIKHTGVVDFKGYDVKDFAAQYRAPEPAAAFFAGGSAPAPADEPPF